MVREIQPIGHDYVRIAAEAVVHPRTVQRMYGGAKCSATTRERVRRAANLLGFALPPQPQSDEEP